MCSTAARGQAPPAPVFDPPVTFTTIDNPFDLAAADVDLDGNIDLAVSAADGNSIWVYLNRGPTFWATTPTKGLKLIGIFDNTVCNTGTFTATEIPNLTFGHFEFAGYPRDAYPDLAMTLRKAHTLWYLRNKGVGAATPFEHGACVGLEGASDERDVVAADFDGDSYDDVAIACRNSGNPRLAIVWNNAAPSNIFTLTNVNVPFTGHAYELDLVHAGGVDSNPTTPRDLVMTDPLNAFVYVFKDGTGETVDFHDRRDGVPSRGITAAELNAGDSHWDLATSGWTTTPNDLRWLEALGGTGGFVLDPLEYALPNNAHTHGVASGKLNADDWIDVVAANEGTGGFEGNVSVFINKDGNEATLYARYDFAAILPDPGPTPHDAGPVQVLLADLNGDGYLDIITTNSRDDTISVLINSL